MHRMGTADGRSVVELNFIYKKAYREKQENALFEDFLPFNFVFPKMLFYKSQKLCDHCYHGTPLKR